MTQRLILSLFSSVQELDRKTGTPVGEKRALLAQEILLSELAYMNCLSTTQNVFKKPLEAALASNRFVFLYFRILLAIFETSCRDYDGRICLSQVGHYDKYLTSSFWAKEVDVNGSFRAP